LLQKFFFNEYLLAYSLQKVKSASIHNTSIYYYFLFLLTGLLELHLLCTELN